MEYPQLVLSPAFAPALVHELAHQWFFRLVGNDQWAAPWLDETLSSFAAMRLGRAVHGPDRLRGCVRRSRPARPPAPVDSDMGTLQRRPGRAVRDTLYVEGPCALFNLQRRIGRDRTTAFLRGLVGRHRRGVLTTPELRDALARLPTGRRALRELRVSG
jgi:aminopeptidase N